MVSGRAVTFLVLYVDDIITIENDIQNLQLVKNWLSKNVFVNGLIKAVCFLRIKIYHDR